MPEPRATQPRWRLDAVAITLAAAGGLLAACVGTYRPLAGASNLLGPAGTDVAAALVNALGLGSVGLLVGWFAVVGLYVARRGWGRLAVRAAGWAVLTVCVTVCADYAAARFSLGPVSAYGKGGSVGAYLRFALDDALKPPLPGVAVVAAILLGLVLAADNIVRAVVNIVWLILCFLGACVVKGNAQVAVVGDRVISWGARTARAVKAAVAGRLARKPVEIVALVAAEPAADAPPPIIRHTALPAADPAPAAESLTETIPEPVPISHPTPIVNATPPLRVHVPDAPESEPIPEAAYELPPLSLLADPDAFAVEDHEQKLRDRAALLEKTFQNFGLNVKVVGIHTGPVVTQYEVALDTGMRLNKVTTLSDDLALNLGVAAVRIVAPLPGRNTVGIEVPNEHRQTVRLKELALATTAKAAKFKLPIFLGKDVEGRPLVYDMATMPHLLIAGRTGTGKSVCLNAIILSFLLTRRPDECRMIMIDPKKVELSEYGKVPHLMHPVVTDDKKSEAILGWAVDKMEERYELLRRARVRNIATYNDLGWDEIIRRVDPQSEDERQALPRKMPYIVIIVDEVGDLLMSMKKEVEGHIIRLAQKSRAAGIHLILATQKPTVDVITGLIKSNLPARICFQVASRADSAVVLDEKGADKLLGMGDMLFLQPGTSTIIRAQGAYVDDREIERVVGALEVHEPNYESELLNLKAKESAGAGGDLGEKMRERDSMYEQAVEIVIREQRGSTSLLQRALGVGYGRASRLIDFMAEDGIVGTYNGSSARDVLVTSEEWNLRKQGA
ncbi:DNA translocase FtsK [Fimbriiglobus ruber]|uniref:Cell division protein FtsK n=1 Tax=Fimbriiglobus ruber TaxID=1908690 RepID=A0A225D6G1_9BACT|nr:DNA translocase FtsK [Fimbriiglobus ruber]OWK36573.1 Cell division protein FtsK [Fimbriiglobus ruber]